MKTLYFLRHGLSRANNLSLVNGKVDDPLTDRGRKQARAAGRIIAAGDIRFDACFVSHWRRAQETAELAFPDARFTVDARLGETDPGEAAEVTFAELPKRYPEFKLPFDPLRPYPGGESHQQLYNRSVEWFEEAESSLPQEAIVLAVSHGGPICSILQYICKVDISYFPMFVPSNASFSKIIKGDTSRWKLQYFSLSPISDIEKS